MSSASVSTTLFAAMLAAIIISTTATKCPIGTFRTKKASCQKCSPGTYQDTPNQPSCKKCPSGTFTAFPGVISERLCLNCPNDSNSAPGSSSCTKCPKGGVGRCGKCIVCPPGTFVDGCKCRKCFADSFSTAFGVAECTKCPGGQRATDDRRGCRDAKCPVGTQWVFDGCEKCGIENVGSYLAFRNASMATCAVCPPRMTVENFFEPQERCFKCRPGEFLTDVVVGTLEGVPICLPCGKGRMTRGVGKVFCRRIGAGCPSFMFEDADGDCDVCDRHQRYVPEKKKCVDCAKDEVSEGGLVTKCRRCGGGRVRSYNSCLCPAGKVFKGGMCRDCPAGTYRGERGEEECLSCGAFEFSGVGASECKACPEGTNSRFSGGKKCEKVKCPKGFILLPPFTSRFGDGVCVSGATGCPMGLSGLGYGIVHFLCADKKGKVVCEKGTVFNGVDECLSCSKGFRLAKKKNGRLDCALCPHGTSSEGGLVKKCERCAKGLVWDRHIRECLCPRVQFMKNGKCQSCPKGSTFVDDPIDGKICVKCRAGTVWNKKNADCVNCPVNSTSVSGATKCTKCPKGTVTYEGGGEIENQAIGDANCVPL